MEDVGSPIGDVGDILDALAWHCEGWHRRGSGLECYAPKRGDCEIMYAKALGLRYEQGFICHCSCHVDAV